MTAEKLDNVFKKTRIAVGKERIIYEYRPDEPEVPEGFFANVINAEQRSLQRM